MDFTLSISDPTFKHMIIYYGRILIASFTIAFVANISFSRKNLNVQIKLWGSFLILFVSFFVILKIVQIWEKYSRLFI